MMESFGFTDLVMATNPTVKVKTDIQTFKEENSDAEPPAASFKAEDDYEI